MTSWSPQPPTWSKKEQNLLPNQLDEPARVPLTTIMDKSESFPRPFPIDTNRCKTLKNHVGEDVLERNANSAYPVVHENILHLFAKFILHKRRHGSAVEKALYKDMDVLAFVDRLLTKRAATFMGKRDLYTLMDGKKGSGGWETVGTSEEKPPLTLSNCLSYEEMKLSAFLSVSSYTYFVNAGERKNFGVFKNEREGIEDEGVIMGVIGPRLVKEGVMEYQELVVTEKQNTKQNGYGKVEPPTIHQVFADLYEEDCLDYQEVLERKKATKERYTDLPDFEIFDNVMYYKRLLFTVDTLFSEANSRAAERNTTAYIHVVGIGLGVWKKSSCQIKLFMDFCGQRIEALGNRLTNVSDICFSYIQHGRCLNYKHGDVIPFEGHPLKGIKVHMYNREPHTRLTGADEGKLLVVSYAWDGNALPGNEFWNKKLGSSGDSAAASSTQITELHNPFVNPKVCAKNLRVVTDHGVVWIGDYVKREASAIMEEHLYDELLVELECPICTNYMSPPIRQCATGHSICESCRRRLPRCALCQGCFTDSRNLSLEGLAVKMRYPCINKSNGCNVRLSFSERDSHELRCPHRGFRCAMEKCAWVGRLEDLANHWASKKTSSKPYHKSNVCHTKMKTESYYVNIVDAYDKLFWFKCKLTKNKLFWAVQYIGNTAEAENYSYEVEIFKPGRAKKKILISDYCQRIDLENSELFSDDNCVAIHTDSVSSFVGEDQLLLYYLRVNVVEQDRPQEAQAMVRLPTPTKADKGANKQRDRSKGPGGNKDKKKNNTPKGNQSKQKDGFVLI